MIELQDFRKPDELQLLIDKAKKLIATYFSKDNPPDKNDLEKIKKVIPDFKPNTSFLDNVSRVFSSSGKYGRKRALSFLNQLDSFDSYLKLMDAILEFCMKSNTDGIPKGKLRKSFLDLLVLECGITNDSIQREKKPCYKGHGTTPIKSPSVGLLSTSMRHAQLQESAIWLAKSQLVKQAIIKLHGETPNLSATLP